jgi:cyclopropane-fatty-acyl-phospholipid synthase
MSTSQIISSSGTLELSRDGHAPGLLGLAERGLIPDPLLRWGIRRQCVRRLNEEHRGGPEAEAARFQQRLAQLRATEVALYTDTANHQHYELPPELFVHCLGPRLKYSSAYYPSGNESLTEAEEAMLVLYGQRAQLADGQDILELGCGWGSLTLWMAERYPHARI